MLRLRTIVPTALEREALDKLRIENAVRAIDLARQHEELRTRQAKVFKAHRQHTTIESLDMSFENTIVETLNTLTANEPKVRPRILPIRTKKVYPLHLTCPIVELARQVLVTH